MSGTFLFYSSLKAKQEKIQIKYEKDLKKNGICGIINGIICEEYFCRMAHCTRK